MASPAIVGFEQLGVSSTAVGLAAIPTGAVSAIIAVETDAVRFRADATSPTSVAGFPVLAGQVFPVNGNLHAVRFIRENTDAVLSVLYYDSPIDPAAMSGIGAAVSVSTSGLATETTLGSILSGMATATKQDTANTVLGATSDAAITTDTTGSISGKLRGLVKWAFERMPASLGQKAMSASLPVVIASDQSSLTIGSEPALAPATDGTVAYQSSDKIYYDNGSGFTAMTVKYASVSRNTNADGAAVVNIVASKKIKVLSVTLVATGATSVKWQSATSNSTGAGSNTDLTGLMAFAANGGMVQSWAPGGLFETAAGEGLKLNSNSTNVIAGYISYVER